FHCGRAHAIPFQIQTVDSLGFCGIHSSMALDSRGQPHISYYSENRILYASKHDSTWSYEAVASDVGFHSSLAIDRNDAPHLCYYTSIAFDRAGQPCVSYLDLSGGLRFARRTASGWSAVSVEVGANVGPFSSLALDSLGYGRISYADVNNHTLKYAEETPRGW